MSFKQIGMYCSWPVLCLFRPAIIKILAGHFNAAPQHYTVPTFSITNLIIYYREDVNGQACIATGNPEALLLTNF